MTKRRLEDEKLKARILIEQQGRCAYCNSSLHKQSMEWDHFIPYSYLDTSGGKDNWVASCSICNRKKASKVFSSVAALTKFCVTMITDHGSLGEGWPDDTEEWQKELEHISTFNQNRGRTVLN